MVYLSKIKMKKFFTITFFSLTILSFVFTLAPIATVFSADYVPLSPLPDLGADKPIAGNFSDYLLGVYKLAIGIAGVLAVIVILFEGIKHMASESFVAKADTSARIGAAIGGLLLALGAYVILYAINPKLVEFNLKLEAVPAATLNLPPSMDALIAQQEQALRDARVKIAAANGDVNTANKAFQTAADAYMNGDRYNFCISEGNPPEFCQSEMLDPKNTDPLAKAVQNANTNLNSAVDTRNLIASNATAVVKIKQGISGATTIYADMYPLLITSSKINTSLSQLIESRKLTQSLIDQNRNSTDKDVLGAITTTVASVNTIIASACDNSRLENLRVLGTADSNLITTLCDSGELK